MKDIPKSIPTSTEAFNNYDTIKFFYKHANFEEKTKMSIKKSLVST